MRRAAILRSQLDTAALQHNLKSFGFLNHNEEQSGAQAACGGNLQTILERLEGKFDSFNVILQTLMESSFGFRSEYFQCLKFRVENTKKPGGCFEWAR